MTLDVQAWIVTITSVIGGIAALGLAVMVLAPRPRRPVNVALSVAMLVFGVNALVTEPDLFSPSPWVAYNTVFYLALTNGWFPLAYLAFLGEALRTPLVAWARTRVGVAALVLVAVGLFAWGLADSTGLVGDPNASNVLGHGAENRLIAILGFAVYLLAIVAALDALRRTTRGSAARHQMLTYVAAFVVLDLGNLGESWGGVLPSVPYFYTLGAILLGVGPLLIGRALLRFQLFDFDLKVKWTLKRGTLVAIILGAFFVVSALTEQYLQQFGWIVGGLAVGALLFALRPIERAIDRMADRAMPKTTGTPEYLAQRKHEIYRAAIEEANADGAVSAKERRLLLRLASDLALTADEAQGIERDVLEAAAP